MYFLALPDALELRMEGEYSLRERRRPGGAPEGGREAESEEPGSLLWEEQLHWHSAGLGFQAEAVADTEGSPPGGRHSCTPTQPISTPHSGL